MENCTDFSILKSKRDYGLPFFGVSNLGSLKFDNKDFNITFSYIAVALQGSFYEENNIYLTTKSIEGKLFFTLLYPTPLMKKKKAKTIMDGFFKQLVEFI